VKEGLQIQLTLCNGLDLLSDSRCTVDHNALPSWHLGSFDMGEAEG
jgi:hypothetical protein